MFSNQNNYLRCHDTYSGYIQYMARNKSIELHSFDYINFSLYQFHDRIQCPIYLNMLSGMRTPNPSHPHFVSLS